MKGNLVLFVAIITPVIMLPLVLGGVYLGYFVADSIGSSRTIFAIGFSTVGFVIAFAILMRVIRRVAGGSSAKS